MRKKIAFDPPKRIANLDKHQLDLADVEMFDWDDAIIIPGYRDRFGKPRFKAIGRYFGLMTVVIYAELGSEAISVISFRVADAAERQLFDDDQTKN